MTSESTAIVSFEGLPSSEVRRIMKSVVAKNSAKRYDTEIIRLILWLYNDERLREDILRDTFLDRMHLVSHSEKEMRKECKTAIAATEKGGNNCPIVLQKLTFNIFSHYLATRRTKANKYLSKTSYGGVRSALMHLYRLSGETISEDFNKLLREFLSGMKRTATQSKVDNGESLDEGKKQCLLKCIKKCVNY